MAKPTEEKKEMDAPDKEEKGVVGASDTQSSAVKDPKQEKSYVPDQSAPPNLIEELYTGSAENTLFRSPMVADSYLPPYNSDDLWQKYGDYRIYEDMGKDDQVAVCLRLKRDLVLGSGFYFHSEEEDQEDIVKDLEYLFNEQPETSIEEMCEEILSADEFGFSLSEKIFKTIEGNKLALKTLQTRHPNSWKMYQDEKGHVTKYTQWGEKEEKEINPKSLIHFINQPRFQNPYGTSDLRACYNAWFVKRQVVKYYGIFMEKAASPTPIARYDKNAPKESVDEIFKAIKSLQAKTAMALPKDVEVEYLEAKNSGDVYEKAINVFNMFIARALFVPDLIGLSGEATGSGSYALGKEQMRLFFLHINRKRKQLESVINKQIVEPIVYWNYGYIPNYPKFKFKPIDQSEAVELAKLWSEAVKGKLYKPTEEEINYFRKLTNFPEGEVEFYEQTTMQIGPDGRPIPNNPFAPNSTNAGGSDNGADADAVSENPDEEDKTQKKPDDGTEGAQEKKEFKAFNLPPGDYHRKVNFTALKTKLNDYDNSILDELQPIQDKIFKDLISQIESKRIVQTGNVDKLDSLKIKYLPDLRRAFERSFKLLYKDSQSQAATELNKANYRLPTTAPEFEKIVNAEVYKYIADYEYKISSFTKTQLIAAIKDGAPLSTVTSVLDDEGKKLSQSSLERFARTKHTEIMNRGRVDYFDSTGVVAAYQFTAIMDNATTDICAGCDGKIFESGDQPVPPLHFNCRSTLIPITKYEEFTPTKSIRGQDPQTFIEDNKGSGFSTQ